jgi:4-carboxymuconolactone decarboxylase
MARISPLKKDALSPQLKDMFTKFTDLSDDLIKFYCIMAHSPLIAYRFLRMGNAILFKGVLPPTLRELAILRVGHLNRATFEWAAHVSVALRVGVRREQIDALPEWEHSGEFNEWEKAVLRYTDEETSNIRVSDEAFASVRTFLNEEGIIELTATIGYYGMVCRLLETLGFQIIEEAKK